MVAQVTDVRAAISPAATAIRGFGSEEELVSSFGAFLFRTNGGRYEMVAEHEAGFGRPDVLLFSRPSDLNPDIQALARIPVRLAPLLAKGTAGKVKSIQDVARLCGVSSPSAARIVRELEKIGRLKRSSRNEAHPRLTIAPVATPPFANVVAIEAKLRDWRRALIQAYRYLEFANESWVLLDHRFVGSSLKAASSFKSSGVGLASFSFTGELFIHIHARHRAQTVGALAWRTQALLSRHLVHTSSQN